MTTTTATARFMPDTTPTRSRHPAAQVHYIGLSADDLREISDDRPDYRDECDRCGQFAAVWEDDSHPARWRWCAACLRLLANDRD